MPGSLSASESDWLASTMGIAKTESSGESGYIGAGAIRRFRPRADAGRRAASAASSRLTRRCSCQARHSRSTSSATTRARSVGSLDDRPVSDEVRSSLPIVFILQREFPVCYQRQVSSPVGGPLVTAAGGHQRSLWITSGRVVFCLCIILANQKISQDEKGNDSTAPLGRSCGENPVPDLSAILRHVAASHRAFVV